MLVPASAPTAVIVAEVTAVGTSDDVKPGVVKAVQPAAQACVPGHTSDSIAAPPNNRTQHPTDIVPPNRDVPKMRRSPMAKI